MLVDNNKKILLTIAVISKTFSPNLSIRKLSTSIIAAFGEKVKKIVTI